MRNKIINIILLISVYGILFIGLPLHAGYNLLTFYAPLFSVEQLVHTIPIILIVIFIGFILDIFLIYLTKICSPVMHPQKDTQQTSKQK